MSEIFAEHDGDMILLGRGPYLSVIKWKLMLYHAARRLQDNHASKIKHPPRAHILVEMPARFFWRQTTWKLPRDDTKQLAKNLSTEHSRACCRELVENPQRPLLFCGLRLIVRISKDIGINEIAITCRHRVLRASRSAYRERVPCVSEIR